MSVKDRIKEFCDVIGITTSAFEKSIGVANGYVNSISRSVGIDKINTILEKYPNISIEWLLTGKGLMFKDTDNKEDTNMLLLKAIERILTGKQKLKVIYPDTFEDSIVAALIELASKHYISIKDILADIKGVNNLNGELLEKSANSKLYYETVLKQAEEIGRLKERISQLESSGGQSASDADSETVAHAV